MSHFKREHQEEIRKRGSPLVECEWFRWVDRVYTCPVCATEVRDADHAVDHLRNHRYTCPLCSESYPDTKAVISHMENAHLKRGVETSEEEVLRVFLVSIQQLR